MFEYTKRYRENNREATRIGNLSSTVHTKTSNLFYHTRCYLCLHVVSSLRPINLAYQWGKNSWECAWGCVAMRVMLSQKFWNVQNSISNVSRIVTTKIVKCTCVTLVVAFREQFVTYAWQMARDGANYALPYRFDRLRATMALLGTPYCRALREQNSCQCEACLRNWSLTHQLKTLLRCYSYCSLSLRLFELLYGNVINRRRPVFGAPCTQLH